MSKNIEDIDDDTDYDSDFDNDNDLTAEEKIEKNSQVRKRIEDLMERKRLKELLDDSDDWDF